MALTEVLVSMALLALAGLFVLSSYPALTGAIHQSRQRWRATTLAYNTMAERRGAGWSVAIDQGAVRTAYNGYNHLIENGRGFVEDYVIEYWPTRTDSDRLLLTVRISWNERGTVQNVTMTSVLVR